jgi:hypothetical protein
MAERKYVLCASVVLPVASLRGRTKSPTTRTRYWSYGLRDQENFLLKIFTMARRLPSISSSAYFLGKNMEDRC